MCHNNYNMKNSKFKHLLYVERTMIERWYNKDKKNNIEIARLLNKSERTIRREIKRGITTNLTTHWETIYVYSADIAQQKYDYNIKAKGPELKISNDFELKKHIENEILVNKKSPEAIVADIKNKHLEFKTKITSKIIRNNIKLECIFDVTKDDLTYTKTYNNKNKIKRISKKIPPEKSIEYRPEEANKREIYGHWEGDCVVGKRAGKGPVLFTLTERKTREEIIFKVNNKKTESIIKALNVLERKYKKEFYTKFKTITFDNGSEFNDYEGMEKSCLKKKSRMKVYYAHPYCSGERGSNENNNRLIRRWIPKGTDIKDITDEFVKKVESWINNYPRKIFDFKSTNMILYI